MYKRQFETPTAAQTAAGYLTITNTGAEPDQLIAVKAPFPRVMLHETVLNDGVATMEHLDGITIAPGASVSLEPGGAHVMFMGLQGDPFEEGETIAATLVFEKAGSIDIAFSVEARKDTSEEEHSH